MSEEIFAPGDACAVSLAASVAAGCLPCAGYYIERAQQAGVGDRELREVIALAESLRTRAAADFALRARRRLGDAVDEPAPAPAPASERELLLSLAAAYAVNSHALTSRMLDEARRVGAGSDKMVETIRIARGVRNMAIAIVDRHLLREGVAEDGDIEPNASCACG